MSLFRKMSSLQQWRHEHEVVLNEVQRDAVSWYFNSANKEGEPWPLDEPVAIGVEDGHLVLNGLYLLPDGEWSTRVDARWDHPPYEA